MLDSLRPFVIPALSAKGQKLAFMTRGPFSCRRQGGGTAAVPGGTKAGVPCMGAGSNAQAWAGRGTGAQIIRTGTVFQCAPTAADPAAAARGELTEVGAERDVQHWAEIFHQAMCAARSCFYTASAAHDAWRKIFTRKLCGRRGSGPCTPAHGSRYGRCRIFLSMHADVHRFCNDCTLWWRTSPDAAA